MKPLTVKQIKQVFQRNDLDNKFCIKLSVLLDKYAKDFYIDTPIRRVRFLAQAVHETGILYNGKPRLRENLNYSISKLKKISLYFRTHLKLAQLFGRSSTHPANQKMIANYFYWDRLRSYKNKLGNTEFGDGWKYRGYGIFQITGKENILFEDKILCEKIDFSLFDDNGELRQDYDGFILSGMSYWYHKQLYKCNSTNCVTNKINSGLWLSEKQSRLKTAIRIKKLLIS